jgi:hypothetical protein
MSSSGRTVSRLNFPKQGYFWLVNLFIAGLPLSSILFCFLLCYPCVYHPPGASHRFEGLLIPLFNSNLLSSQDIDNRLHPSLGLDNNILPPCPQLRHPFPSLHNPRHPNQHGGPRQRNLVLYNRSPHIPCPCRGKRLGRMGHEKKSSGEIEMDYLFFGMVLCAVSGVDWDYCD